MQAPKYLSRLISECSSNVCVLIRSSHRSLLYVSTNINTATYGERAYSYASTKLWNALVPDYYIKSCDTVSTFKTALKTYLYKEIVTFNILIS